MDEFSGAFCAGLIEAGRTLRIRPCTFPRFPALFAPASLKRPKICSQRNLSQVVFRRFLRRPH